MLQYRNTYGIFHVGTRSHCS